MTFFGFSRHYANGRYTSLPAVEHDPDTPTKTTPKNWHEKRMKKFWKAVTSHAFFMLLGAVLGIAWSFWPVGDLLNDGYIQPSGYTPQVWYENHTFVGKPSALTQNAWEALIPVGKGFVAHPRVASPPKAVAAYHQIHCLHGIRIAYYTRINEVYKLQGKHSLVDHYIENMGANVHLYHLDHCFEYLRQALICAADSNLEDLEVDDDGNAVAPGWGTKRVCRDYQKLGRWSTRWRASDDETIL